MTPAARTIGIYGLYLVANGVGLLLAPNLLLRMLGLAGTDEPWIRVAGLVAAEVGYYLLLVARREVTALFWPTVHGRVAAASAFVALATFGRAPWQLLLFAAVDIASAAWTSGHIRRGSVAA
jgi:hypothetical protein